MTKSHSPIKHFRKKRMIFSIILLYCFGNLKAQEKGNYKDLAEALQNPKEVRILDLSENQLTTFPKEIGQLQKLQKLYLNENRLITLPKEIGQLKNLRWLSLKNNTALIPQKNKIQKLLPNTKIDF
ncbi:E-cadherin-binding leucine-rich repeat protein LRR20 [Leptospira santarosai]|uniref:E-cadherin-binding leucine-rich repeat protein LRR20 n=1 Tax=Leptospira santarosai TaxID=28183 RepID=UPI0002BF7AE6|nr:leucine-rich repeat domain-containing protein [Leptospira santarosai]EMO85710.1 leucine rich repeat protein [Leptospira santarosai str. AIM]MDI7226615.1 leucine-rich repeat domain-containing protein [Leptospira santarosai]